MLLILVFKIQAQECIVLYPPGVPPVPNSSYGDPSILENYAPTFVRTLYIAAHIVRSNSGSGGISAANLNTAIAQLNTAYQDAFIRFELSETDYIDNSAYTNLTREVFIQLAQINVKPNKLNIYFVPSSSTLNGIAYLQNNRCAVTNTAAINTSTLPHEVGHNLYLYHTHSDAVNPPDDCTPVRPLELVNGSNCEYAGDFLCDTPAEPFNCGSGVLGYVNSTNCTYTGTFRDPNNQLYIPDVHNFMGYSTANCRNDFTQLQVSRMHYTLISSLSYLISESVVLTNKVSGNNIPNTIDKPSTLTVGSNSSVASGTSVNLLDGYVYQIKTNQERFPSYLTYGNIKHNNWNNDGAQFKLKEYYPIDRSVNTDLYRDANFLPFKYSRIEGKIDGLTLSNLGTFQFKDPWYVMNDGSQPGDYWIPCITMYEPNGKAGATEKGLFYDQDPTFDPNIQNYSVKVDAVQDVSLQYTGVPAGRNHKFYFQKWSGTNANFQNANNLETPVVFTLDGATAQANLKGTQLSNTNFSGNSGQRSFLRDDIDGCGFLHNVYSSMGKIYYERSTDNGLTWHLMNGGKPINPSTNAKSPSICDYWGEGKLYITYQASGTYWPEVDTDGILVTVFPILSPNDTPEATMSVQVPDFNYSIDYRPVIAAHVGSGVVVYDMPSTYTAGLKGFYFLSYYHGPSNSWKLTYNGDVTFPAGVVNQNSANPSIAADWTKTHLVFDQSLTSIKYYQLGATQAYTVSTGSSAIYNLKPTISVLGFQNGYPVITWIGGTYNYSGGYSPTSAITRVGSIGGVTWGAMNYVSGNIQSVSNASNEDATQKTLITWSYLANNFNYSRWQKRVGTTYTSPASIYNNSSVLNGIWTQATTDDNFANPKALIFSNYLQPLYYFVPSTTDFVGGVAPDASTSGNGNNNVFLGKITEEDTIVTFGRSGVASINDIEFVFEIGDILVGDSVIKFIEIPDTLVYTSTNELNQHTRTNNFTLAPTTNFYFSNIYQVVQKSNPDTALTSTDAVNFKAELVNAITNQVVGTFDNVTYNKNNVAKYASIDYSVDCSGITAGEYYLRLVTNVNGNASYTLANIFNENTTLAKKSFNKVNFTGSEIPTTYDLAQNYPNPFNPGTTIRYQIPQDGIVTLRIYDILGAEVATLVNEEKVAGKYEVNFNASSFASGVYIYKIQSGEFVSSKKMLLIK